MEFLAAITDLWLKQAELCEDKKKLQFGDTAARLWGFLGKSYRQLYIDCDEESEFRAFPRNSGPHYKPRMNLAREFISVMLPYIMARSPRRLASPRKEPLPAELAELAPFWQQKDKEDRLAALLMQQFSNWVPMTQYDLVREGRTASQEALVKGRGLVWTEMIDGPYGEIPVSEYESVDNLLIDADCVKWRDAGFIIRKRRRSAWRLADEFGINADKIRGARKSNYEKARQEVTVSEDDEQKGDVVDYYEIFSRMGLGHKLPDAAASLKEFKGALDELGPHLYLVIMPGLKHPLNLKPETITGPESTALLRAQLEWPIAFFEDRSNPWPCSILDFIPGCEGPWATSPLEGPMPILAFLDHLYAFLFTRVRATGRDIILTSKELEQAVKDAIASGLDQEVVSVSEVAQEVSKYVDVIQFPAVNADYWKLIPLTERAFERQTGMDPLLYGGGGLEKQMRSAAEADIREQHASSRPDDYADCVEAWQSQIASKEAQATRMHVSARTFAPLVGEEVPEEWDELNPDAGIPLPPLANLWASLVTTNDPAAAASEFAYTIESGSARRRNKAKETGDVMQLSQSLMPLAIQLVMGGKPDLYNELVSMLGEVMMRPLERLMMPVMLPPGSEQEGVSDENGADAQA